MHVRTENMWLVYIDQEGNRHLQLWEDLTEAGTLIDPETGDDMEILGWTVEAAR